MAQGGKWLRIAPGKKDEIRRAFSNLDERDKGTEGRQILESCDELANEVHEKRKRAAEKTASAPSGVTASRDPNRPSVPAWYESFGDPEKPPFWASWVGCWKGGAA